jgi:hypothetical protein
VLYKIPLGILKDIKKEILLFSYFFNIKLYYIKAIAIELIRLLKAGKKDNSRFNNKLPGPLS